MKSTIKIITFVLSLAAFTAVSVPNPAEGLFSTKFGTDAKSIITSILTLALGFAGLIAVAYVMLGGYQIATAAGNDESAKHGRKTLTNAIIGLVIIIMSYIIVTVVVNAAFGDVKVPGGNSPAPPPGNNVSA